VTILSGKTKYSQREGGELGRRGRRESEGGREREMSTTLPNVQYGWDLDNLYSISIVNLQIEIKDGKMELQYFT